MKSAIFILRWRQVLFEHRGHDWIQAHLLHQMVLEVLHTRHLCCELNWMYRESRCLQAVSDKCSLLAVWLSFQAIFLFFLIKYKPLKYNNVYTYPDWGYGIGWMMAMSSMVCIPLGILFQIWKTEGTFREVKTFCIFFFIASMDIRLCWCPMPDFRFLPPSPR